MIKKESILDPKEVEAKLYDYQFDAVLKMNKYIKKYDNKETNSSALVAMPTGSGKTPIIAALARCLPRKGCVLVLSPRKPVINQLFSELSDKLFNEKFKNLIEKPTKPVYDENARKKDIKQDAVLCWTIQKLHTVFRKNPDFKKELKNQVCLILFDEGHYEPALQWSTAVRSFNVPRIIFTATPFRNDFKKFDIDWDNNVYRISYKNLLSGNRLRHVNIDNIGKHFSIEDAVDNALRKFELIKDKYKEARLIIKCDSAETIIVIANHLKKRDKEFIAFHENFDGSFKKELKDFTDIKEHLFKTVPVDQNDYTEDIWVHQFKLIEGIDSNKFRCLAIIDEMSSSRALVQQIGRIIRKSSKRKETAFVYNYTEEDYLEAWEGFMELDNSGRITQTLSEQIFEELSDNLLKQQYVHKKVRNKLTANEFKNWTLEELKENLQMPLKANFIEIQDGFDCEKFRVEYLEKYFKDKDHVFFENIYGDNSGLYLYFNIQNSPYLRKAFFPEITHHMCFFKEENNFLIFYDSGKLQPIGLDEFKLSYGVKPEKLRAIFKQTDDTVVYRVDLKNSNIGTTEPHSQSLLASSIEETTPNLNDFSHFLSSAFGYYTDKKIYRDYKNKKLKDKEFQIPTYIGFGTGRISQNEGNFVKFKEYLDWIKYITKNLKNINSSSIVFDRYTTEITGEIDPVPECILLDVFDFIKTHKIILDDINEDINEVKDNEENTEEFEEYNEPLLLSIIETFYILEKSSKDNHYYFNLIINNRPFSVKVKYDYLRNRYLLESPKIDINLKSKLKKESQKVESLIKSINRKQCFRILTNKGLSYSGGRFYKPHFKFGKDFNKDISPLAKMIFSIDVLDNRFSEKGIKNGIEPDDWQDDSIFQLISERGDGSDLNKYFIESSDEKEELLICTDLGTEPADFIFVTNKKIAFIHVKGKGNNPQKVTRSHYGATPISNICNQAVKNANYLSIFDNSKPKNLSLWSKEWKLSEDSTYIVKNRIRNEVLPDGISKDDEISIWDFILKKKMDVNISKEIWIVMGYTFNRDRFIEEVSKKEPEAEAKQAALTLESTLASIHSLGIKLKVFCS